jgi:hypothetical protein
LEVVADELGDKFSELAGELLIVDENNGEVVILFVVNLYVDNAGTRE